jgi:hypothetical protein
MYIYLLHTYNLLYMYLGILSKYMGYLLSPTLSVHTPPFPQHLFSQTLDIHPSFFIPNKLPSFRTAQTVLLVPSLLSYMRSSESAPSSHLVYGRPSAEYQKTQDIHSSSSPLLFFAPLFAAPPQSQCADYPAHLRLLAKGRTIAQLRICIVFSPGRLRLPFKPDGWDCSS